ncbi:MAG: 2-hydroxyacid dehydrogenase [Bdellovibrionota bacterium]
MKVAVFSSKPYEEESLKRLNGEFRHELRFLPAQLSTSTAALAQGFDAVSAFVSDTLDEPVLKILAAGGTRYVALRSAGFNHVDLKAAKTLGIRVARVPAYSPHAVAEYAVAMILALNRKIPRAYNRVRDGNFSLEGLMGFDLAGKTAGVVGCGKIGTIVARVLKALGCHVLCFEPEMSSECRELGLESVELDEIFRRSSVLTLHCPLSPGTRHLVDARRLALMPRGAMLVNTGRGALVDTAAVIEALKKGHLGSLAIDVYEEESELFFKDFSNQIIQDDVFTRLMTFPNVLITGHQGFFTKEAVEAISRTTLANIRAFELSLPLTTEIG